MEREVGGGFRMGDTCRPMHIVLLIFKYFTDQEIESEILNKLPKITRQATYNREKI